MPERERLIARIRQIRRTADAAGEAGRTDPDPDVVRALEARIAHLEQQLQGFQDSVHREAQRQQKRIAELEARIDPATLSRALSADARERGL